MNLDNSDLRLSRTSATVSAAFLRELQRKAARRMEQLRRAGKIRKPITVAKT